MMVSVVLDCLDWHFYCTILYHICLSLCEKNCKHFAHWWSPYSILKLSQNLSPTGRHLAFLFNWTVTPVPRITRSLTLAFHFYCIMLRLHTTAISSSPSVSAVWNHETRLVSILLGLLLPLTAECPLVRGRKHMEVITGAKQHKISEPSLIHSNS